MDRHRDIVDAEHTAGLPKAQPGIEAAENRGRAAQRSWELIQTVQQGQAEGATEAEAAQGVRAFAEIYETYHHGVQRLIWFRVRSVPLAEDLASEVFLRALRRCGSFRWQGKDLEAWLNTIAINLVSDHFKSKEGRKVYCEIEDVELRIPDSSPLGNPEEVALEHLTSEELKDAIKELTPDQQEVIYLRYFKERSYGETARAMGKNESGVKALAHRGVRSLCRILTREAPPKMQDQKEVLIDRVIGRVAQVGHDFFATDTLATNERNARPPDDRSIGYAALRSHFRAD